MLLDEKKYVHKNVEVTYLLKEATSDKKHLVVIFTGFGEEYSFLNIGSLFKCNVLWIKDSYDSMRCYYLGKNGEMDFEEASNSLILTLLNGLNLRKSECTLLGGSKGGFSALYFGIKHHYKNIIASAPTSLIGYRMSKIRPSVGQFVMGGIDEEKVERYNSLLLEHISKDFNHDKNIYLFLSKDDDYYKEHQAYLLPLLAQYNNFNLIMVNSDLAFQHNVITKYSVPLIISFINCLLDNITPKFGYIDIGEKALKEKSLINYNELVALSFIKKHSFNENYFYIEGSALFKNISVSTYGVYKKKLSLNNGKSTYNFTVGTVLDKYLSGKFYSNEYIDYTAGGFANLKGQGIDLSDLELGVYQLNIEIEIPSVKKAIVHIKSEKDFDSKHIYKNIEYRLWTQDRKVYLSKRLLIEPEQSKKEDFNINLLEIKDSTFFISGHYSILGIELENWREANYYVVFSNSTDTYSYRLGMEHKPALNDIFGGFGVYQKSAFATLQHQGISLDDLTEGEYNISLIISYKGTLIRKTIKNKIIKKKNKPPIIL